MAMIDYGSVVKKNGKIIQKEMFMDMKEAVGFEIESAQYIYKDGETYDVDIKDEFFSYMGDRDLLVCVYKCGLTIVSNNKVVRTVNWLEEPNCGNWNNRNMVYNFEINEVKFHLKRLAEGRQRYKLRFEYKNNLYECLYGYGVDVNKNAWYNVESKEQRYIDKWFK